jgi:bacillithiol system protein YtxJ
MSDHRHAAAPGGFRPLSDGSSIDELIQESHQHPVVLFKHDPFCGVSAAAQEELEGFEGEVVLLDVSHQHELKKQVVERTGVRHESPGPPRISRSPPRPCARPSNPRERRPYGVSGSATARPSRLDR